MFNRNEVRRYKPIEYDEMPGDMVTAEDFDRMYEAITNHVPDPPPSVRAADLVFDPSHPDMEDEVRNLEDSERES